MTSRILGARLVLAAVFVLLAPPVGAVNAQHQSSAPIDTRHISDSRVAAGNVVLTGGLAVARGLINGEVRSWRSGLRHAATGMAAGYGFFEAKRLIGAEHELPGMLLAYTSASVLRNVGEGRHPAAEWCGGPGPVDLCIRTGVDGSDRFGIRGEVNAMSVAATSVLITTGMTPRFRSGILHLVAPESLGAQGDFVRTGYALGRTVVLSPDARADTWRHELIHVVQSLQAGALTPYHTALDLRRAIRGLSAEEASFRQRSWDVQIDWLFMLFATANALVPYERQWNEIEAYRLTRAGHDVESDRPVLWVRGPGSLTPR